VSGNRGRLILAFLAIYFIWGSTYLGMKIAIETIPPFFMAAGRFLVAGAMLYVIGRATGGEKPTRRQWITSLVLGALLLLGGDGGVAFGEQTIPSSLAALLIATEPLWIAILDWLRPGGKAPTPFVAVGLLIGFAGVALLVSPGGGVGGRAIDPVGVIALLTASCSWAIGSLYTARGAPIPKSSLLATGMQMLAGSVLLALAGLATGEQAHFSFAGISARSWWAMAYLIFIGALLGFSAYTYILRNASPAKASTYAYVNPAVAVFLGWALAGETITSRMLTGAAIIIGAVIVITTAKSKAFEMARNAFSREPRRETDQAA